LSVNRRFGGTYGLYLQGQKISPAKTSVKAGGKQNKGTAGNGVFYWVRPDTRIGRASSQPRITVLARASSNLVVSQLRVMVGGLLPLRCEEGRPKAVRDKVAGKGQQQNY
jgi:hypothetical protein